LAPNSSEGLRIYKLQTEKSKKGLIPSASNSLRYNGELLMQPLSDLKAKRENISFLNGGDEENSKTVLLQPTSAVVERMKGEQTETRPAEFCIDRESAY
jgi:hypothetical protein